MNNIIVPEGWMIFPLKKHSTRVKRKNKELNTNILTASAQHGLVNQKLFFNKTVASADISNYTVLHKDDFAYNKSYSNGYPVGVIRRLTRYKKGILSPLYICFTIKSEQIDNDFLTYHFDSYWFERQLNSVVQEGARAHGLLNISVDDFFNRLLLLPPLLEQKKIAEILTSVDNLIEKTQSQINKLQDLKRGTMNELLTRGIGHTEFKDSPVGRIPKEWGVKRLGALAEFHNGHGFKASKWEENGFPIIRIQNLNGSLDFNYYQGNVDKRWFIPKGTLLFAWSGQRGKSFGARIWKGKDGVLNQHIFKVEPNALLIVKDFLLVLLKHVQIEIEKDAHGFKDSFMHVTKGDLVERIVSLPPLKEQQKIASVLSSIDNTIEEKQRKLEQTKNLKKSLMQDLLTGKIRVPL